MKILIAISTQTLLIGTCSGGNSHSKFGIGRGLSPQKPGHQEGGGMLGELDNERLLNKILKQLVRHRQEPTEGGEEVADTGSIFESSKMDSEKQVLPEYTESLPENTNRESRHLGFQSHRPICKLERRIVSLNNDEYEYRPAYYEEVKCIHKQHEQSANNEICSSVGFTCVQWNKTIHLTRRLYTSNCWESDTMIIPAGCECMWPSHKLGEIRLHL